MKQIYKAFFFALVLTAVLSSCMTDPVQQMRSVTVQGTGTVFGEPDTASFTVGYSELADTTREAQSAVSRRMHEVMDLLLRNGVPEEQIKLQQLSIRPEYQWKDGDQILKGQRVRQSLHIEIRDISVTAPILDELGDIQGIEISSITFSIADTLPLHIRARDLAFEHAYEKALQLAGLGGMELGLPITIEEQTRDSYIDPVPQQRAMVLADAMESSVVPPGTQEVTSRVTVVFELR